MHTRTCAHTDTNTRAYLAGSAGGLTLPAVDTETKTKDEHSEHMRQRLICMRNCNFYSRQIISHARTQRLESHNMRIITYKRVREVIEKQKHIPSLSL